MAMTNCRECGQPVSTLAGACPHCGVPLASKQPIQSARGGSTGNMTGLVVSGAFVLVLIACVMLGQCDINAPPKYSTSGKSATRSTATSRPSVKRRARSPNATGDCVVRSDGSPTLVATTEDDMRRLTKLCVARDEIGVRNMVIAGQAFTLVDETRVLLIDGGVMTSEIRVLDGPHAGESCFIDSEFLAKE